MTKIQDKQNKMLPKGWKEIELGNIFDFNGGMPFSRSSLGEEGCLYLHYGDVHMKNQSTFDTNKDVNWLPKIDIDKEKVKETALLKTGDIVFADASEDYEGIGKSVVIINKENLPFISGLHTIVATELKNMLDNGYKKYFLSTNNVRRQFVRLATGATVLGISKTNIKTIEVLVPPINQQHKIAAILSTVDNAIEKTEAIIKQTEKVKKGLMQRLLTKGIGHTKFKSTEIGEIPEEWDICKIGELAKLQGGYAFKSKEYQDYGVQLIRISNLFGKYLNLEKDPVYLPEAYAIEYQKYKLEPNDLIICMTGTVGKEDYGHVIKIPENQHPLLLNQRVGRFKLIENINIEYFYWYLSSRLFLDVVYSFGSGSKQANLSAKQIESIWIPIPSIQEQMKIGNIISSFDTKVTKEKEKLSKLQYLKKGLMQVLLTGKVRVKVDEAEVTSS